MRGLKQGRFTPAVVVIDSCTQVRESFQFCFPTLEVVGLFTTVEEFLNAGVQCDLVIVDAQRDGVGDGTTAPGTAAVEALVRSGHQVCVLSAERRLLVLVGWLSAGAAGLASKSDSFAVNEEAFAKVAQGDTAIAASLDGARNLLRRRGSLPRLTTRQSQVLHARARGESWKDLADRLGISAKTAYDRLECVRAKLGWFLQDAGLGPEASPADIEYALGLTPRGGTAHAALPDAEHERKRSA